MNKDLVMSLLLGVLLAVSVLQAWQVSQLVGKVGEHATAMKSVGVSLASAPAAAGSAAVAPAAQAAAPVQAAVPAALANLPSQVGGC